MSSTEDPRADRSDEIVRGLDAAIAQVDTLHAELDAAFRARVAAQQERIDAQRRILDQRDGVTTRYSYASGRAEPVDQAEPVDHTEARATEIEAVLEPLVRVVGITGDVTLDEDLAAGYGDTVTLRLTARVTEVRTRAGYIPDAPTRKRWELTVQTLDLVDGTAVESGPDEATAATAVMLAARTARLTAAATPPRRRRRWGIRTGNDAA